MRAAVVTEPYHVEIRDIPKPSVEANDVLIKVEVAGICGSDLHLFKGTHAFRKPPAVLGHEMAGTVVEVGKNVKKFKVGDRVTVEPQVGCGQCRYCGQGLANLCLNKKVPGTPAWVGTFVEYFVAPEQTVYSIPESLSFAEGLMAEPLAVAVHAVRRAELEPNDKVAILGSGTIGLLVLLAAKAKGVQTVYCTDVVDFNLEMAKKLGANATVHAIDEDPIEKIRTWTDDVGVDKVIIAAGPGTIIDQASAITRRRGRITLVAMITKPIPVYTYSFVFNEQILVGSQTYQSQDFAEAVRLLSTGEVDVSSLITQELSLAETEKGLKMLANKNGNIVKIVVRP